MEEIKIEKINEAEWLKIVEIESTQKNSNIYYSFNTVEEGKKNLAGLDVCLIIVKNNIVGYVAYKIQVPESKIHAIVVLKEYQGKGVCKTVFKILLNKMRKAGAEKVWLVTHPDNKIAISIYQKLGFSSKEKIENYYGDGEPRNIMEIELTGK